MFANITTSTVTRSRAGWWATGHLVEITDTGVTTTPVTILVADTPGPVMWTRLVKLLERARLGATR